MGYFYDILKFCLRSFAKFINYQKPVYKALGYIINTYNYKSAF